MKLRETIDIEAARDEVWPFLASPSHWPRWNPRILRIDRPRSGPLLVSEQFSALFQMKRRQTETEIHVREIEAPNRLLLRQYFHRGTRARFLDVAFSLERLNPRATRVIQTIDHAQAGIPFPFRLLIRLAHRFGRPVGTQPLPLLRQLVETGAAQPAAVPRPHLH